MGNIVAFERSKREQPMSEDLNSGWLIVGFVNGSEAPVYRVTLSIQHTRLIRVTIFIWARSECLGMLEKCPDRLGF